MKITNFEWASDKALARLGDLIKMYSMERPRLMDRGVELTLMEVICNNSGVKYGESNSFYGEMTLKQDDKILYAAFTIDANKEETWGLYVGTKDEKIFDSFPRLRMYLNKSGILKITTQK